MRISPLTLNANPSIIQLPQPENSMQLGKFYPSTPVFNCYLSVIWLHTSCYFQLCMWMNTFSWIPSENIQYLIFLTDSTRRSLLCGPSLDPCKSSHKNSLRPKHFSHLMIPNEENGNIAPLVNCGNGVAPSYNQPGRGKPTFLRGNFYNECSESPALGTQWNTLKI